MSLYPGARGGVQHWVTKEGDRLVLARQAGPLDPAWPVAVVLAGERRGALGQQREAPARASRQGFVEHVVAADHSTILGPAYSAAIVRAIEHVRAAAGAKG